MTASYSSSQPDAPSANELNDCLIDDVQSRLSNLDEEKCREWGGTWADGQAAVTPIPADLDANYRDRTVVRSVADAMDAFEKYTAYFEFVLDNYEPNHDAAVLLPCGANKPIGSSAIHQKKLDALKAAGYRDFCDIVIISEPCTVVPHEMRLTIPPTNYDFPPEYTEQDRAPNVFDVFVDRLATFFEEADYDTLYPYLPAGHQSKFEAAVDRCGADHTVTNIPGSSLNADTMNLSGDLFKSVDDITAKLEFVRALKGNADYELVENYPDEVKDFYADREEY